ncbi:uncharacterized protein [Ptychodera flava]|uniref:uncharacterized protein n=1 Tax=Ptychodera flava TaxID=63121 RepID=UPI003969EBFA
MPSKSRKTQDSNEGEKVYDIFFSYNANDDKWVKEAVHKLETKEKLKCAFAQRDFVPERLVHVRSSGRTDRSSDQGTNDGIVPVILKRCDTPYFISHLTHLNAQGKNFWKQFTEIVRKPSNSQGLHGNCEILREYAFGEKVDPLNGKIITTEKPSDRFLTNFDAEKIHRSLISKGISISEHDLGEALERLGNTTFVAVWRYHWPLLFSIMFIFWVYALYKTANLCVQFQNMATTIVFIIIGCLGFIFSSTQIDQRSVVTAIEVVINQWTKRSRNYFGNILFLKLFELYIVYCVIVIWLSIINDYVMWLPDIYGYLMIEDGDVIKTQEGESSLSCLSK